MHRKNFGGRSGVIVDVCTSHGTWFDAEELPRVLAFVEAGGLERVRLEQLARAKSGTLPGATYGTSPAESWGGPDSLELQAAILEMLSYVVGLVIGLTRR